VEGDVYGRMLPPTDFSAPKFSRRLRLRVWWRQVDLTAKLAAGADPDGSPELTLAAHHLIGTATRSSLADGLDRLLRSAARPYGPRSMRAPINRRGVLAARDELGALAERLRLPAPAPAHAVALAAVLVGSGTSPIYSPRAERTVQRLALDARAAFDDPIP
jgi:hypothetical protein